ncbi:MAG: OmpA family protein [Cyclobacteriaceae bacterium]
MLLKFISTVSLFTLLITFQLAAQDNEIDEVSLDELLALLDNGENVIGKKVEMNEVNFEFGSFNLTSETKAYLDKIIILLKAIENMDLNISGHTDNIGDRSENLKLSMKRAESVNNYLVENGINPSRLGHTGFGDTKPISDNNNDTGRALNRRVEFEISREKGVKSSQLQDLIFTKNGEKIGAYNITTEDDKIYYYKFSDNSKNSKRRNEVAAIHYSDGKVANMASNVFLGEWINGDQNTSNLTAIVVSKLNERQLGVHMWGSCSPTDCDWGELVTPIENSYNRRFNIIWDQGFSIKHQLIEYIEDSDALKLTTSTTYTDNSGRSDNTYTSYFIRGKRNVKNSTSKKDDEFGLNGFYFTAGYGLWSLSGNNIDFAFVDDSPSMDNIVSQVELNSGSVVLEGGLEWRLNKSVDFGLGLQGFLGKIGGLGLVPSLEYRVVDRNNFAIRPGASLFLGQATVKMGKIENNDVFIQINDQQYFGESISVKLRKGFYSFQPHITFDINRIRITAGYRLELASAKDRLLFKGDVEGSDKTEEKDLSGSGGGFLVDGVGRETLPIEFEGAFLQIGIILKDN